MNGQTLKRFFLSLKLDIERLETLSEVLDQQYQLMSQRESNSLQVLNQQALKLMAELQQSHHHRSQLLAQYGFQPSPEGLQLFLDKLPEKIKQGAELQLKELTFKARLCQAKNEKSGALLSSQREVVRKLMGQPSQTEYPAHLI